MAHYYLETSALTKLYVRERGTERLLEIAARAKANRLTILTLSQIEFRSAVRRRERNGEIPSRIAQELLELFQTHVETRFNLQPVTDAVINVAARLIDRHFLRAFDAIQLAGFVALLQAASAESPTFVCADEELLAAAVRDGLKTLDVSKA